MGRPVQSRAEQVAREDLVTFINACFSCTGQREFYNDARGQAVSIDFLHAYILGNYRRLYARTLAAGINHFNQAHILLNLLATGRHTPAADREEEGALIRVALRKLPPPRAWRVLAALRERRINNRRARAVAREYMAARRDLAFDAVKYRPKLRAAVAHTHVPLPGELGTFLFGGWRQRVFHTELLEKYRQAHYSQQAVYALPYTVAEGLAARHGIPRELFLERMAPNMTATERQRLQEAAGRHEVDLAVDLGRMPLTKLALYALSLPPDARREREHTLHSALEQAAARALRQAPVRLGRVAAVLDSSHSSSGSTEKRRRPLGVALGTHYLLSAAAREFRSFWTAPVEAPLRVQARGQTDLATPLLEALAWEPELVVVVSDGYENDPPGATSEVIRVFRARLDPERRTSILHLNPVFDSEVLAPRALGPGVTTVGVRDAEDVPTVLGFARFAEGAATLAELEEYLAARVQRLLGSPGAREARPVEAAGLEEPEEGEA